MSTHLDDTVIAEVEAQDSAGIAALTAPSAVPRERTRQGRGPLRPSPGPLRRRPAAVLGLVVIVLFIGAALLAPWISPPMTRCANPTP